MLRIYFSRFYCRQIDQHKQNENAFIRWCFSSQSSKAFCWYWKLLNVIEILQKKLLKTIKRRGEENYCLLLKAFNNFHFGFIDWQILQWNQKNENLSMHQKGKYCYVVTQLRCCCELEHLTLIRCDEWKSFFICRQSSFIIEEQEKVCQRNNVRRSNAYILHGTDGTEANFSARILKTVNLWLYFTIVYCSFLVCHVLFLSTSELFENVQRARTKHQNFNN